MHFIRNIRYHLLTHICLRRFAPKEETQEDLNSVLFAQKAFIRFDNSFFQLYTKIIVRERMVILNEVKNLLTPRFFGRCPQNDG